MGVFDRGEIETMYIDKGNGTMRIDRGNLRQFFCGRGLLFKFFAIKREIYSKNLPLSLF